MEKESYQPSEEEMGKAQEMADAIQNERSEEMMTEGEKGRSIERNDTIEAAGGEIEDKNLKTKIEQLNRIILDQQNEMFSRGGGYEIGVRLKSGEIIVGVSSSAVVNDKGEGKFRITNPRTNQFYSISIESIKSIEKAGKASWDLDEKEKILWENQN